jgi:hypothetical protein
MSEYCLSYGSFSITSQKLCWAFEDTFLASEIRFVLRRPIQRSGNARGIHPGEYAAEHAVEWLHIEEALGWQPEDPDVFFFPSILWGR